MTEMTTLEDRIKNPKFNNWVKSVMLLSFAKDGITEYVETNNNNNHRLFTDSAPSASICCDFKTCFECPEMGCKNKDIKTALKQTHFYKNPVFGNTNLTDCMSQPWEYAKCFMPSAYEDGHSAADTDLQGLITLILNNGDFRSLVTTCGNHTFIQVKLVRNEIMHNPTSEVEEARFNEYIDIVKAMLIGIPETEKQMLALSNIDELSRGTITITGEDIARVINEAVKALKMLTDVIKNTIPQMTDFANRCKQKIDDKADEKIKSLEFKLKEGVITIKNKIEEGIGKLQEETRHGMTDIRREKEAADQTVQQKDGIDAECFENQHTQTENSGIVIRDLKSQSEHDKPIPSECTEVGVAKLSEDVPTTTEMTALEDRIQNPKFNYWVKSVLLLSFAKDGITEYVENNNNNNFLSFIKLAPSASSCCDFKACLKCPKEGCKNKDIKRELQKIHFYGHPTFGNRNLTDCMSRPWEYAKCFMPNGNEDRHSAADTDIAGLISVILNDWAFRCFVTTSGIPTFIQVKDDGNEIMNNATSEVEEAKFKEYIGNVMAMLNIIPNTERKAVALFNIDKLSRGTIAMTGEDSACVINEAVKVLQNLTDDIKVIIPEITDLPNRCTQTIGNKADEKIKLLEFKVNDCVKTIKNKTEEGIGELHEKTRHSMTGIRREKEAADQTVKQKDGIGAECFETLCTQTEDSRIFARESNSQSEQTECTEVHVAMLNEEVPQACSEENEYIPPSKRRRLTDRTRQTNSDGMQSTE